MSDINPGTLLSIKAVDSSTIVDEIGATIINNGILIGSEDSGPFPGTRAMIQSGLSYIEISGNWDLPAEHTIECWIKIPLDGLFHSLIGTNRLSSDSYTPGWWAAIDRRSGANNPEYAYYIGPGSYAFRAFAGNQLQETLNDRWHYLSIRQDYNSIQIAIDGISIHSESNYGPCPSPHPLWIGSAFGEGGYGFNGQFYGLKIHSGAREFYLPTKEDMVSVFDADTTSNCMLCVRVSDNAGVAEFKDIVHGNPLIYDDFPIEGGSPPVSDMVSAHQVSASRIEAGANWSLPKIFTIEAWINFENTDEAHYVIGTNALSSSRETPGWSLAHFSGNVHFAYPVSAGVNAFDVIYGTDDAALSGWHFFQVVQSDAYIQVGIDGIPLVSSSAYGKVLTEFILYIAGHPAYIRELNGYISDFAIWCTDRPFVIPQNRYSNPKNTYIEWDEYRSHLIVGKNDIVEDTKNNQINVVGTLVSDGPFSGTKSIDIAGGTITPDSSVLNVFDHENIWTISFWAKNLVDYGSSSYYGAVCAVVYEDSSYLIFCRISGNTMQLKTGATTEYTIGISSSEWSFCRYTCDGATMRFFQNGILQQSVTAPTGTLKAESFLLSPPPHLINGQIFDFSIADVVLPGKEIPTEPIGGIMFGMPLIDGFNKVLIR